VADIQKVEVLNQQLKVITNSIGNLLVDGFHVLTLFVIGAAVVWSAMTTFIGMAESGQFTIEDILLLFIYLELLAMVGIYFKTNHMPVRYLIYVAITALTRMLISNIQASHEPEQSVLYISGAILILALATLILRYGSFNYPYRDPSDETPR